MSTINVEALYRKWRKPVRAWIRSSNVPIVWIDDLAQEVFARLIKYKDGKDGDEIENESGYVFRVARNVINEWTVRANQRYFHRQAEEDDFEPVDSPEQSLVKSDAIRMVETAMSRLPPRQLLILMMSVYEDMTYKEIAADLGLTYRLVLRDLTRAYAGLRIMLRNTDLTDVVLLDSESLRKAVKFETRDRCYDEEPTDEEPTDQQPTDQEPTLETEHES